ncbi:Carboxylic acid transporter [Penicillium atrosanguineum]|uniref:Carboxylic acid transporter n=2 Tax=Penicillium atrosanguineum TaxID=1132637 RepID=A0A9W9U003_9EURO|nr:Carboxylic acid transporter [Penicillium atrosanguineum]
MGLTRSLDTSPHVYQVQVLLRNPVAILRELTSHQRFTLAAGFLGWTWDSFNFFTVSMTITDILEAFDNGYLEINIRPGNDGHPYASICRRHHLRHARRSIWTEVTDDNQLISFIIVELCSAFCNTLPQVLGVWSLYGIAMGDGHSIIERQLWRD